MRIAFVIVFGLLLGLNAFAEEVETASALTDQAQKLELLLKQQKVIITALKAAKAAKASKELIELNKRIAEQSKAVLIEQGYQVGAIKAKAGSPQIFQIPVVKAPIETPLGKTLEKARERFGFEIKVEVQGFPVERNGFYELTNDEIGYSPQFLLMEPGKVSNTQLHEIRHAYLWSLANGKKDRQVLNVSIQSYSDAPATQIEGYQKYLNYQELSTHEHDFYLVRGGTPTLFSARGMEPEDVAIMKGEKVIQISDTIKKYNEWALKAFRKPDGALYEVRELNGKAVAEITLLDSKQDPVYTLKVYLAGVRPYDDPKKIREEVEAVLKDGIRRADRSRKMVSDDLEEFRARPLIGSPCERAFSALTKPR